MDGGSSAHVCNRSMEWDIINMCFVMQTSIRLVVYQVGRFVRWLLDLCAGTCK